MVIILLVTATGLMLCNFGAINIVAFGETGYDRGMYFKYGDDGQGDWVWYLEFWPTTNGASGCHRANINGTWACKFMQGSVFFYTAFWPMELIGVVLNLAYIGICS